MCRKHMRNRAIYMVPVQPCTIYILNTFICSEEENICTELHVSSNMRISYVIYIFIIIITFQFEIN